MTVEIENSKQIERIEKPGDLLNVFGVKSCKSYREYLKNRIVYFRKKGLTETEIILEGLLKAYNHFYPIQNSQIEIKGWHGKSSFEIIKGVDKLTIIKYQRKDKNSEPSEIKTVVTKKELISLVDAIKSCFERSTQRDFIETKEIAYQYCLNMNIREDPKGRLLLNQDFWTLFFGWRKMHNKLTIMLDSLESLKLINYSSGQIRLLDKNVSIQSIL
jgi:hypothetical protein